MLIHRESARRCKGVVLVPNPHIWDGSVKRLRQLWSLASTSSFERLVVPVPAMQQALDRVMRASMYHNQRL